MKNPWLLIPASDYEAHMSLPEVGQTQVLNTLMASALTEFEPASVAFLGCSTGNGLEHIDTQRTQRAVCVDINPSYLRILEQRFSDIIPGLEVVQADIASTEFRIDPVSMVFAGLIFEYVDVLDALTNIYRSMLPGAFLLAVLQMPNAKSAPVTATPYKSLELLAPIMTLTPVAEFSAACRRVGLKEIRINTIELKQGKAFFVGVYQK